MADEKRRGMILRSIKVERKSISYLRWLLESHDGMATPTTRAGSDDEIDLMVAPDMVAEFDLLMEALAEEIPIEHLPTPLVPPL